jgi:hypothetical protein
MRLRAETWRVGAASAVLAAATSPQTVRVTAQPRARERTDGEEEKEKFMGGEVGGQHRFAWTRRKSSGASHGFQPDGTMPPPPRGNSYIVGRQYPDCCEMHPMLACACGSLLFRLRVHDRLTPALSSLGDGLLVPPSSCKSGDLEIRSRMPAGFVGMHSRNLWIAFDKLNYAASLTARRPNHTLPRATRNTPLA